MPVAIMIPATMPSDATPGECRVYEALSALRAQYAVCYRRGTARRLLAAAGATSCDPFSPERRPELSTRCRAG